MPKKRIFISHISIETQLAQSLKQQIEKDFLGMVEIFVSSDEKTIQAGAKWLEEVDKALKRADLQIVLCSKESVERPWVNFEAGAAWLRGIPVIPICHSGMHLSDLLMPLSALQGIECSQPNGVQKLYDAIATRLKVNSPAVDFEAIARHLGELEKKYMQEKKSLIVIKNPRILCAASEQYAEPAYGFEIDVEILEKIFPDRVTVERKLTKKRIFDLLTTQMFDILHLVLAVDRDNGNLIFSPVDYATNKPSTPNPEFMEPKSFAKLLGLSKSSLVVLATCRALLLAVEVARFANMAAADAEITGKDASEWEECFYGLLAQGKSLSEAFDITSSMVKAPIKSILQKDVSFLFDTKKNYKNECQKLPTYRISRRSF